MKFSEAVDLVQKIMIFQQKVTSNKKEAIGMMIDDNVDTEKVLDFLSPMEKYVLPTAIKMLEIADRGDKFAPSSFYNLVSILHRDCYATVMMAEIGGIHIPEPTPKMCLPWEEETQDEIRDVK